MSLLERDDAGLFYALLRFEEASLALRTALKLDVVARIGSDRLTLEELATRFEFTPQATRTFFWLLAAMKIVQHDAGQFQITEVARNALSKNLDSSRTPYLTMGMPDDVEELVALLRGDLPAAPPLYGEEGAGETLMDIQEVASAVAHGLSSRARNFAKPLAEAIASNAPTAKTLADIGAGSPYVAEACLAVMPSLEAAVLVDRENGMRFAKEIAEQRDIDVSKIRYDERDFFDSIPAADVYCVSNTAHDWLPTDYRRIIQNIRDAKTNFAVCIHEPLLMSHWKNDGQWMEALWMASYALTLFKLTAGQGSCYSLEEHDSILRQCGLQRVSEPIGTCDGCTALFYQP